MRRQWSQCRRSCMHRGPCSPRPRAWRSCHRQCCGSVVFSVGGIHAAFDDERSAAVVVHVGTGIELEVGRVRAALGLDVVGISETANGEPFPWIGAAPADPWILVHVPGPSVAPIGRRTPPAADATDTGEAVEVAVVAPSAREGSKSEVIGAIA